MVYANLRSMQVKYMYYIYNHLPEGTICFHFKAYVRRLPNKNSVRTEYHKVLTNNKPSSLIAE